MGSDMFMESQNFRPRSNKGEWDGDELVILVDRFYYGWQVLWRGRVTPDNESLIKVMLPGGIPPKPAKPRTKSDLIGDILDTCDEHEAVGEEAVEIAVNATARFIVDALDADKDQSRARLVEQLLELP